MTLLASAAPRARAVLAWLAALAVLVGGLVAFGGAARSQAAELDPSVIVQDSIVITNVTTPGAQIEVNDFARIEYGFDTPRAVPCSRATPSR